MERPKTLDGVGNDIPNRKTFVLGNNLYQGFDTVGKASHKVERIAAREFVQGFQLVVVPVIDTDDYL